MSYITIVLIMAWLPLFLGHLWARRKLTGIAIRPVPAMAIAVLSILTWFGLSLIARRYGESDLSGWQAAEWYAQTGKWYFFAVGVLFFLGVASGLEAPQPSRMRVVLCCVATLLVIWTTVWRTIPMYAFLPRTSTRDKNGYMRQSNDFTCGPVSLANLAEHFCGSPPLSERDVARMAGTTYEGTTMTGLIRAAHELGLRVISCRKLTLDELERSGKPAIVFISTIPTVRHATLLVAFRGDRVAFVDPDRSYGYTEMTRARFDRVWYGKTLILAR